MAGAIDARKVNRSIDGPRGRIMPDPYKRVLAAFQSCGRLVGNSSLIDVMEGLRVIQEFLESIHTSRLISTDSQPCLRRHLSEMMDCPTPPAPNIFPIR